MTIHNPPQYRYSLFDQWDKDTFDLIKKIAKTKNYPRITGDKDQKNQFFITLIRTQKSLHDWREFLVAIMDQIKKSNTIDTGLLVQQFPPSSISKDTPAWVTYEEDQIVSNFIDKLETKKIDFFGSDTEASEFTLRFILGQLGHDWEWTIMMIWEMLGDNFSLGFAELNREMKNFDYLKLFE